MTRRRRPILTIIVSTLLFAFYYPSIITTASLPSSERRIKCGLMRPGDGDDTEDILFPLRAMSISVQIIDGIAEVAMSQTFSTNTTITNEIASNTKILNKNAPTCKASHYQLPIDPSATVTQFPLP